MNRYYLIIPVILMALFAYFYSGSVKEARAKEEAARLVEQKKKDAELVKKHELEEKARIDAEKRNAQRIQEEKDREAARIEKYESAVNNIKKDINRYNLDIDDNTKLAAKLEKEIAEMRARREKEGRETFDMVKKVELAKIQRRNAELEIQRYTEMIANRANESAMANPPVIAATK